MRVNEELEVNKKIIVLFLEKIELLNDAERKEILKIIQFFSNPVFVAN